MIATKASTSNIVRKRISAISEQPVSLSVSSGDDAIFSVNSEFPDVEYQWYEVTGGDLLESKTLSFTSSTEDYPWTYADGLRSSGGYHVSSMVPTMKSDEFTLYNTTDVSFDWSVSCETGNYDYVYYTIYKDGEALSVTGTPTKISGTTRGTLLDSLVYDTITLSLEPGEYYIEFTYRKDSSSNSGLDAGFVKDITVDITSPYIYTTIDGEVGNTLVLSGGNI